MTDCLLFVDEGVVLIGSNRGDVGGKEMMRDIMLS